MSALSELLQTNLPEGWSARRVARETEGTAWEIKPATATAYFGGRHGRPDERTLEAFHRVLRIPLARLRAAAGLTPDVGEPWTPPATARHLDADERRTLDALIKVMTRGREEVVGDGDTAPTSAVTDAVERPALQLVPEPEPAPMAARPGTPDQPRRDDRGEESQDHGGNDPV